MKRPSTKAGRGEQEQEMVKVRLARAGAKKKPFYRVVVTDSRSPRDGRFIEQIGYYDPKRDPAVFQVDRERLDHWLKTGAQTSETLGRLIQKLGEAAPPA
jgi:small subunit ribosomal protein S16